LKNVNNYSVLNLRPTIVIDNEGLEAIKHIVSIAPQEAQWFHTVEPVEYKQSPGEIFLYLSTKLYIPKQNTSAAQVDSNASMMIEFYNELKTDYQDQEIINQKLSSMTCWCHSHVNMNPSPSGQDDLQFNSFINDSQKQNLNKWQIMLIFNKKDQFYSRVYDPTTGLIFEGVDIISENNYDFNYINQAAKTKFLKPKVKNFFGKKATWSKTNKTSHANNYLEDRFFSSLKSLEKDILAPSSDTRVHDYFEDPDTIEIAENLIDDVYHSFYPDLSHQHLLPILPKNKTPEQVFKDIELCLQEDELVWLSFICKNKEANIKNIFTPNQVQSYLNRYPDKPKEYICKYLEASYDTLSGLKEKFLKVIAVSKCEFSTQVKELF